ncbi:MAG: GFA family protein [Candidatus Obscuribacterales bacterium]|nr:GFA family protein [Steroidobacteraceae bacterium]
MVHGSCLCGAVRYEADAPFKWMAYCHCSMCRKSEGGLFNTSLGVPKEQFRWISGETDIARYQSAEKSHRDFCKHCGSSVPHELQDNGIVGIPAGGLEDDPGIKPQAHIFVGSKSKSYVFSDSLPQFPTWPGGDSIPSVNRPAPELKADVVQGSCLCGGIAFEIDEQPTRMVNCHCSRCRRSRGTAHGTNFFVDKTKLRWVRGADKLKTYKVPDAKVFATSFCGDCGSVMPASFDAIGTYLVPVGSIDTPLTLTPAVNIQVGSKAPWFTVDDSLPQFEAMPPRERMAEFLFDWAALKK